MLTKWQEGSTLDSASFVANLEHVGHLLRKFHDGVVLGADVVTQTAPFSALDRARNYMSLAAEFGVTLPAEFERLFAAAQEVRDLCVHCLECAHVSMSVQAVFLHVRF